jgi:hypothetical protein
MDAFLEMTQSSQAPTHFCSLLPTGIKDDTIDNKAFGPAKYGVSK